MGYPIFLSVLLAETPLAMTEGTILPKPIKKQSDGKEYLTFTRYNSTYQTDMGLQYIVERSTDLRTWSSSGVELVGSATDLGGEWSGLFIETTSATSAGNTY